MIPLVKKNHREALAAIGRLQAKLAAMEETVSPRSRELTLRVFGQPLSPRQVVDRILGDVRSKGDEALLDYCLKLDGVQLTAGRLRVGADEIRAAHCAASPELLKAIRRSAANIRRFQKAILAKEPAATQNAGICAALRYVPLRRAGIHIPGASAPLFSTVLMTAIPAQVAGVKEIALCTPPGPDGKVRDAILAACAEIGVEEVYRIGGAQAIAAMAYGTRTIRPVDIIAGPGNVFTTLAKMAVFGRVQVDMPAGPSEVAIVADKTARADFVAADMLAQAEHYPGSAVAIVLDERLANALPGEIERIAATLERGKQAMECLYSFGLIVLCGGLEEALELVEQIAPEHLEIVLKGAKQFAARVRSAGAVFVGPWTPTVLGDYYAGPSHTLPTGGSARAFSGLSANTFRRSLAVIRATAEGLRRADKALEEFARSEGLTAHGRSASIRSKRGAR